MKIKSTGFIITDEESGIVFELRPKTEDATQQLVEKFFDSFQILKVETEVETPKIETLMEEKKPSKKQKYVRLKPEKITNLGKPKPEKRGIPNPSDRHIKILTDLPEEFVIADIGNLFEKEGYSKKKIIESAYHDIDNLILKKKIFYLENTKPKRYKIISRDTSDL